MELKLNTINVLSGTLSLQYYDLGEGPACLLLHPAGGTGNMLPLAKELSNNRRVIIPLHPGFENTKRPAWLRSVGDLALAYLSLLEKLGLSGVLVAGNSFGGWIAAEMAVRAQEQLKGLVLIDAAGIDPTPENGGITDIGKIPDTERASYQYFNPAKFPFPAPTPEIMKRIGGNMSNLMIYGGNPYMHNPELRVLLSGVHLPTLVLWGESDRIIGMAYGKDYASLIPGARFVPVPEAGHYPQLEQTEIVAKEISVMA